jgi:hypothetical protein
MNLEMLGVQQIATRVTRFEPMVIDGRTFKAAIARGGPVERAYGTERLRISPSSIDLSRTQNDCMVPLLDSLREDSALEHSLGKLISARIEDNAVVARVRFHQTKPGQRAADLIMNGALDIAVSYAVDEIEVFDSDNRRIDPNDTGRANEGGIVFEVCKWQIVALSLVRRDLSAGDDVVDRCYRSQISSAIAACFNRMSETHMAAVDANCDPRLLSRAVRPQINISIFGNDDDDGHHRDIVAATRARMAARQKLIECGGGELRDVVMPPDLIYYGRPETM